MKLLIFLLLPLSLMASTTWKSSVQKLLPEDLQKFELKKTSLTEIETKIGKANLVEGDKYYWEKDGLKYALQLTFNSKKILTSLHYTFTGKSPSLDEIKGQFDFKKFSPYPSQGRGAGRFLITKEKYGELIIDPAAKTIHTVKFK